MTDLTPTIAPKSDQLNADDLISGPKVITITRVTSSNAPDQPISIFFEGDNGKPYKPCKSMRRVLVKLWGTDGNAYVGHRLALYRDDKVQFGGIEVGGIRISHASDIEREITMPLTVTKARRAPYTVRPLRETPNNARRPNSGTPDQPKTGLAALFADAREAAARGTLALEAFRDDLPGKALKALAPIETELAETAAAADGDGLGNDDDFPGNDALRGGEKGAA